MCEPTTIMLALSVAATGVSMVSQRQQAAAQVKATDKQNEIQSREIARQAGQQQTERSREARRERATARVLSGEAGVNLGSNSFVAQLQQSAMNQYNDMGLVVQNEKSQQAARQAQSNSIFAGINKPSWGEIGLGVAASGYGAYMKGMESFNKGAASAGG